MGHALVNGSFAQIKEDIIVYDFLHPVKDIIVNNHTLARGILQVLNWTSMWIGLEEDHKFASSFEILK